MSVRRWRNNEEVPRWRRTEKVEEKKTKPYGAKVGLIFKLKL